MSDQHSKVVVDGDVSRGVAALRQLDAAIDRSSGSAGQLERALEEAGKEARQLADRATKGFDDLTSGVGKSLSPLKAMGGRYQALKSAAEPLADILKFVGDETARLDTLSEQAAKSGLGLEAYQRLGFAASLAGTDVETLSKATLKLDIHLRDIEAGGGKKAVRALQSLGLTVDDLTGKSKTEQLAVIADAMGGIADEGTRGAIAVELLGESGRELLPTLAAGGDAIRETADGLGKVFTQDELAKAEAYQDSLAKMNKVSADLAGTLAIAVAPTLQQITDELSAGAGAAADGVMPILTATVEALGRAIRPVIGYVGFFVDQWEAAGRGLDVAGSYLSSAADGVGELSDKFGEWFMSTWAGGAVTWLGEVKDEAVGLASEGLGSLSDAIAENVPYASELADVYDRAKASIVGTHEAMDGLAEFTRGAVEAATAEAEAVEQKVAAETASTEQLERSVTQAEHLVNLAEAQKRPAAELERLYQNQHAAKLELLLATQDHAALEKELMAEEIRKAKAKAGSGGGGAGPTEADKLKTAGEIQIKIWEDQLRLQEAEAELWGTQQEDAVRFAQVRQQLAIEELELERSVLEVTRGKNSVERSRNEARIEAIDREIEILGIRQQAADQAADTEDHKERLEQRIAMLDREIERNEALGVSVQLLQATRDEAQLALVAKYGTEEELAQHQHDAEILKIDTEREADVAAREAELERFEERMAMLEAEGLSTAEFADERLAYELAIADAEGNHEARRKAIHKAEIGRIKAEKEARKKALADARSVMGQGLALGETILNASIKNDAKRERAALRLRGIQAVGLAALETVEGIAAIAGQNYVGAALHFAAATAGFIQGGMMIAGQVPGNSGGGSAGSGAGGGEFQPSYEGDTSPAQRDRPSTPASAEELTRIRGGSSGTAETKPTNGGNVTNLNNNGIIVTNDAGYLVDEVGRSDKKAWGS